MKSLFLSATLSWAVLGSAPEKLWQERLISDWMSIDHKTAWEGWKKEFGWSWADAKDEAHHFITWLENWEKINEWNSNPHQSYWLGVNQFTAMDSDEFQYYVHGHLGSCLTEKKDAVVLKDNTNPGEVVSTCSSVDWETEGKVTPVKDQGSCGSCWSFSATGAVECRYAISKGTLNSLSEQELVDCSDSYGNSGCNGGIMQDAFKYIEAKKGLSLESSYKYTGKDGTCKSSDYTHYDPISGYEDVTVDDESALASATCDGCVSVAIQADQTSFQSYSSGILNGTCGSRTDHGVLVVGFGTSGSQEYWKVKNSWGTSWGEDGYVRICKNCDKNGSKGECGINTDPSYPTI